MIQRSLKSGSEGEPEAGQTLAGTSVPSIVDEALSSGQPLDKASRVSMEPLLGHNFSKVRVHADPVAASSASAVNVRAYTVGHHIFFRDGQYAPQTVQGRKLLAHELTHVVQQDRAGSGNALQLNLGISNPYQPAEREADAASDKVMAGQIVQVQAVPTCLIHRNGDEMPAFLGYDSRTGVTTPLPSHRDARRGPTTEERLTGLEAREVVHERRDAARQFDARWRGTFNRRLLSYQRAIWRISHAINAAAGGFQLAQSVQAQTDQMEAQAWGLVIAVGTATLFEPLASAGLGRLGSTVEWISRRIPRIQGVEDVVEAVENPAVALVGGYASNIRGVQAAGVSLSGRADSRSPPCGYSGIGSGERRHVLPDEQFRDPHRDPGGNRRRL